MRLGDIEITAVSDGTAKMPPEYFVNADWGPHRQLLGPDGMLEIALGCFVVRTGDVTVLVDAGIGPVDSPLFRGGDLPDGLRAAGVAPEDVDVVACTHLHLDHTGWLVRDERPFFPNATVRFGAGDWKQFVEDMPNGYERTIVQTLEAAGRVEVIDGQTTIAPGVTSLPAPGHTLGHTCYVVSSGDRRALLLGDAISCPVQLGEPEWMAMSDVDAELAKRTREALWREIEGTEDVAVASHFPDLKFNRVLVGEGKRYWS